jgi:exopolysaccharide production protein ExoZ
MKSEKARVDTLDWLRGLLALSIMFYHLTLWLSPPVDSSTLIGRLGIYGVSMFFVLSGLSMAIGYNNYIVSVKTTLRFFIRRIFRIWPLLWIATILTVLPEVFQTGIVPWKGILVNLTTLFGFIKPTGYIAVGAWSIGNEMVYYLLTPLIFFLYNYNIRVGNLFLLLTTCLGFYFGFFVLDSSSGLSVQWHHYVNPANNFFLYVLGVAIYFNFHSIKMKRPAFFIGGAILAFIFLPFSGDPITIVTNAGRVLFVILCSIIVYSFYKLDIKLLAFLSSSFEKLGLATYGIYILHPIVFQYSKLLFPSILIFNKWVIFGGVSTVTIFLSFYLYKFFELPIMRLGKKITS